MNTVKYHSLETLLHRFNVTVTFLNGEHNVLTWFEYSNYRLISKIEDKIYIVKYWLLDCPTKKTTTA